MTLSGDVLVVRWINEPGGLRMHPFDEKINTIIALVKTYPTNFAIAIPRLAKNAARIALLLPPAAIGPSPRRPG